MAQRYVPPVITVGEQVTGANLNTRFDAVATATTNIPRTQIDEHATWPSSMFAEDAAPGYWTYHGLDEAGLSTSGTRTWTLGAHPSGRFLGCSGLDNATGATGSAQVLKNGTAMAANETIAETDVITAVAAAGFVYGARFRWRHVGRRG